jgi:hypothetical protein
VSTQPSTALEHGVRDVARHIRAGKAHVIVQCLCGWSQPGPSYEAALRDYDRHVHDAEDDVGPSPFDTERAP